MSEATYVLKVSTGAATCIYDDKLNIAEIIKMRGNFWKSFGYHHHGRNLLYPEEALYLLEKGNITIEEPNPMKPSSTSDVPSELPSLELPPISTESNPNPSPSAIITSDNEADTTTTEIEVITNTEEDTGVEEVTVVEANDVIEEEEEEAAQEDTKKKESESTSVVPANKKIHFPSFYEKVVDLFGLPCYLVYSKLKVCIHLLLLS